MNDEQRAVARIEAGDAWDDEDEVIDVARPSRLDKVVPVRLSSAQWSQLRQVAVELGVGPSTLLRMWMVEKLKAARATRRAG